MAELRTVDVAVVGAGPAGLAAAVHAAESGARVLVVDQAAHLGGQIWRHADGGRLPGAARRWLARFAASGAGHLPNTTIIDAAPGFLALLGPQGPLTVRAGAIVLATGARELLLPFPGWTLPNVFGVGGLQALVKSGLPVRGRRIVIAGTGPLVFPVAATVATGGGSLVLVGEQADAIRVAAFAASLWRSPGKLVAAARYRAAIAGSRFRTGCWAVRAEGDGRVERVVLTDGRRRWRVECDLLATAAGLIPNVEIAAALGCAVSAGGIAVDDRQETSIPGVYAAGECTGVAGEDVAVAEGAAAGRAAAGREPTGPRTRAAGRAFARRLSASFAPRRELLERADASTVVCRCEDVRYGELQPGWGTRQAKLLTRAGMGACQGRVCGAALERMFGWEAPAVRPPLAPVPAEALSALGSSEQ